MFVLSTVQLCADVHPLISLPVRSIDNKNILIVVEFGRVLPRNEKLYTKN